MKLLTYSLLRLAAFVVPFVIMWQFAVFRELWWLAAIFSALISLALSMIFLRKPLAEATSSWGKERVIVVDDADAEDAANDEAIAASSANDSTDRS